ncbi:thioredoxin-like domain-containing protein [Phocaeicola oris]|uniref:thioredoxin-like domain-containing protein n=1 Tax=Phocaeicola oris TaxID=2896850 RepID=UPI00234F4466|nr:thioredoxin-like domain-containing protein [Phocaeicola oris]MCE2616308.1 DUF4369 domain-containing protein [Phocaeicola oris]
MKKGGILMFGLLLGLSACNNEPKFVVEGEVSGAENQMLYFEESGIEGVISVDSTKLNANGAFRFTQKRPIAPEFYRLRLKDNIINFAIDSTEVVNIKADSKNFATGYTIEDSENNIKIKELVLLQNDLQNKVNELGKANLPLGIAQDSLNFLINSYKDNVKRNYIFKEPNKTYAYFALFQTLNGYMIFDPLSNKEDVKCFGAVATSMNNVYPHSDRSRNLYNTVIKGMKNTRTPKMDTVSVPAEKIKESGVIEIALNDLNAHVQKLTDLKGKVVLLDFTVYNNAMSSTRNLALRELYNKYAERGFEIYQVSLDTDEHFWKTQADKLPWICVRDPNGIYSAYVNIYGISNLPTVFLINRNNELLKRYDSTTGMLSLQSDIEKIM